MARPIRLTAVLGMMLVPAAAHAGGTEIFGDITSVSEALVTLIRGIFGMAAVVGIIWAVLSVFWGQDGSWLRMAALSVLACAIAVGAPQIVEAMGLTAEGGLATQVIAVHGLGAR